MKHKVFPFLLMDSQGLSPSPREVSLDVYQVDKELLGEYGG